MVNPIDRLIESDRKHPKRILVAGDVISDIWVHGTLHGCQDHCPKFVETSRVTTLGGAAGAARQLENWQSHVSLNGGIILPDMRCSTKTRYVEDGTGKIVFRHDEESGHVGQYPLILAGCRERVLNRLRDDEFIRQVIDHCNKAGVPVVADAKREPKIYEGAIIKCNDAYAEKFSKELENFSGTVIVTRGAEPPLLLKGGKQVCIIDSA
jgi:bifunctional ADP-heptose synthase (sugar kinase/adenylyltransferase)